MTLNKWIQILPKSGNASSLQLNELVQLAGMVWDGAVALVLATRLPDCNRRRDDVVFRRNRNIIIHPQAFRSGNTASAMRCSPSIARRTTSLGWIRIALLGLVRRRPVLLKHSPHLLGQMSENLFVSSIQSILRLGYTELDSGR